MRLKDVMKLKPGEVVMHTRYGESVVQRVMLTRGDSLFGVVIVPVTENGRELLEWDSGADRGEPLLEDSIRRLKRIAAATGK